MLSNEVRVILAGVDLSYTKVEVNSTAANIIIQYTDYWDDVAKRFRDDMKNIIKYEPVPVMVLAKHPADKESVEITFKNAIIIFEGLIQRIDHRKEPKTNLNTLVITASKLSNAVLGNISYKTINIPLAFQNFGGVAEVAASQTLEKTSGEAKVEYAPAAQGSFANTSITFLKKLILGKKVAEPIYNPDDLYETFVSNLLLPADMDPRLLDASGTINITGYYLNGKVDDGNVILKLTTFSDLKKKVDDIKAATWAKSASPRLAQQTLDTFGMYPLPTTYKEPSRLVDSVLKPIRAQLATLPGSEKHIQFIDYMVDILTQTTYTTLGNSTEDSTKDEIYILLKNMNLIDGLNEEGSKQGNAETTTVEYDELGQRIVTKAKVAMTTEEVQEAIKKMWSSTETALGWFFSLEKAIIHNILWHVLSTISINKLTVNVPVPGIQNPTPENMNALDTLTTNKLYAGGGATQIQTDKEIDARALLMTFMDNIEGLWNDYHGLLLSRVSENGYTYNPSTHQKRLFNEFSKYFFPSGGNRKGYSMIFHHIVNSDDFKITADIDKVYPGANFWSVLNLVILKKIFDTYTGEELLSEVPKYLMGTDKSGTSAEKTIEFYTVDNMLACSRLLPALAAYTYDMDAKLQDKQEEIGGGYSEDPGNSEKFSLTLAQVIEAGPNIVTTYKGAFRDDLLSSCRRGLTSKEFRKRLTFYAISAHYSMLLKCETAAKAYILALPKLYPDAYTPKITVLELMSGSDIPNTGIPVIDDMLKSLFANYRSVLVGDRGSPDFSQLKIWDIITARYLRNYNIANRFGTYPSLVNRRYDSYFPTFALANFTELKQAVNQIFGAQRDYMSAYEALAAIYNQFLYNMTSSVNMPVYERKGVKTHPDIFLSPMDMMIIPPKCNVMIADKRYNRTLDKMHNTSIFEVRQSSVVAELSGDKTQATTQTYVYDALTPTKLYTLSSWQKKFGSLYSGGQYSITNRQFYELDRTDVLDIGPYVDFLNNVRKQFKNENEIVDASSVAFSSASGSGRLLPEVLNVDKLFLREINTPEPKDTEITFGILDIPSPHNGTTGISTIDSIAKENQKAVEKNKKDEIAYNKQPTETRYIDNPDPSSSGKPLVQTVPKPPFKKSEKERYLRDIVGLYKECPLIENKEIPKTILTSLSDTGFNIAGVFGKQAITENDKFFSIGNTPSDNSFNISDSTYFLSYFKNESGKISTSINLGIFFNHNMDYRDTEDQISIGQGLRRACELLTELVNRAILSHILFGISNYMRSIDKKEKDDDKVVLLKLLREATADTGVVKLYDYITVSYKDSGDNTEISIEIPDTFVDRVKQLPVAKSNPRVMTLLDNYRREYVNTKKIVLVNYKKVIQVFANGMYITSPGTQISGENTGFIIDDAKHVSISSDSNGSMIGGRPDGRLNADTVQFGYRFNNIAFDVLSVINAGRDVNDLDTPSFFKADINPSISGTNKGSSFYSSASEKVLESFGYNSENKIALEQYPPYKISVGNIQNLTNAIKVKTLGLNTTENTDSSGKDNSFDAKNMLVFVSGKTDSKDLVTGLSKEIPNLCLANNHVNNVLGESNRARRTYVMDCINKIYNRLIKTNPNKTYNIDKVTERTRETVDFMAGKEAYSYYRSLYPPVVFSDSTNPVYWTGDFMSERSYSFHTGVDYGIEAKDQRAVEAEKSGNGVPLYASTAGYIIYRFQPGSRKNGYGFQGLLIPKYKHNHGGSESYVFMYCHMNPKRTIEFLTNDTMTGKTKLYRESAKAVLYERREDIHDFLTNDIPRNAASEAKLNKTMDAAYTELQNCVLEVAAGDVIGYMGNSGLCFPASPESNGMHLHFEIGKIKYPKTITWKSICDVYSSYITKRDLSKGDYKSIKEQKTAAMESASFSRDTVSSISAFDKNIEDIKYAILCYSVHPHVLGLKGIDGLQCMDITGIQDGIKKLAETAGVMKFTPVSLSSATLVTETSSAKKDVEGKNVVVEDCIESLKYHISKELLNNIHSTAVDGVTLNYYDPYFVDGGFPFVMVYDNDMVFTSLTNMVVSKTTVDTTTGLRFGKGYSLRYMLYYYLHHFRNKYAGLNEDVFYKEFRKDLIQYPMFPMTLVEDYNETLLNRKQMDADYEAMFGRKNFSFWWPNYVLIKYVVGKEVYRVNLGEVLENGKDSIPGVDVNATKLLEYILDENRMFELIDMNNDYLTIDIEKFYAEDSGGATTQTVDGETKMLLNYRAWDGNLFKLSKWRDKNLAYHNVKVRGDTYVQVGNRANYMDVYKPDSVIPGTDIQKALREMSSNISAGGSIYNKPLLYQNWYQTFLNIRSKSFKT